MFKLEPGVNCLEYTHVGSRVTCNPPVLDTDNDVLVLCVGEELRDLIFEAGGELCGRDYGGDAELVPMRLGEMNYLLVEDDDYYEKFLTVTAVAKHLNLLAKDDRKALFAAMMDDDTSYLSSGIKRHRAPGENPF